MLLVLAAVAVLSIPRSAHAWADGGHKAIAILAWERLGEKERAWVVALLKEHPLLLEHFEKPMKADLGAAPDEATKQKWLFAQAAVWPDIIRGPRGAKKNPWEDWHRPLWHYIEYPVFASDAARAKLEGTVKPGPMDWKPGQAEFLEVKLNAVQTLKKAMHDVADEKVPEAQRAVMLCWLFHLAGDVHQPCHCATLFDPEKLPTGDRGGNGTTIEGLPDRPLHTYWDDLLGHPGTEMKAAQETAEGLLKEAELVQAAEAAKTNLNPNLWAQESNEAAKQYVYPAPVLGALGTAQVSFYEKDGQKFYSVTLKMADADVAAYQKDALEVARKRAVMGGFRLAEAVRGAASRS